MYITITGFKNYYGLKPFRIGNIVRCEKDVNNQYDGDAIKATMPLIGTVGYLANSADTIAGGTVSASRIYDKMSDNFFVKVCFTTHTKVICDIIDEDPSECEAKMNEQFNI